MPSKVLVGRLLGPFGVRGEIKCRPAGFGAAAFSAGTPFALGAEDGARVLVCTGAREHQERLLLRFEGVDSPEAARAFLNADIYATADDVPLGPNEYLDRDLVGLRLIDPAGNALGDVLAVEHLPAGDYLVVGHARALVPLVRAFVQRVDVAAGQIVVDLPEGLLDP